MGQAPRILRAIPQGTITRPEQGIPVVAILRWHYGENSEVSATATAWTRTEVEITWTTPWGDQRQDWIPADQVRREQPSAEPVPDHGQSSPRPGVGGPPRPDRPPTSAGLKKNNRW